MTFSDLCRLIHPFLKGICKSKEVLFDLLILNSITSENEGLREEIAHMSAKQKRNLCNGVYSISKVAEKIYPFLDMSDLIEVLKTQIQGYALDDFVSTFGCYDGNVTKENFAEEVSNLLRKIILDNSALFRSAQLEGTATLRSELFQEDAGICPTCARPLDMDSSKENAIVAIGVDGSSPCGVTKSIGLCRKCAEKCRNGSLGKDLAKIKKSFEEKNNLRKQTGSIEINEKLMAAIDCLLRQRNDTKVKLSMKSLKISQKIDKKGDFALYAKIKMNVSSYFSTLYDTFGELDGEDKRSYEFLSASIKIAFLKAEKVSDNREAIFNCLVNQVSRAASCEQSIAEIIVSYFVQSCEVFHEISK
ncbi:MAG TPA: hypothetical protein DCR94_05840 [Firmicutes bacterium]|nr:hypothetical protein [Bacillota bacterium]